MADARDLLKRLADLRIVSPAGAQAAASALPAGAEESRLVAELRNRKLITEFQAEAIGRGRPEELVYGENGRFLCHELLGQGGMGRVYKAWQGSVKRWVALKTINARNLRPNELKEMKQRFERELEASGKLKHTHIVTVHDGGVQGDESYLAMEWVEGTTLHHQVARGGPRPWAQACEWIAQAAEGLAYAHRKQVVHRDIKPENLMLTSEGTIKVLDLGLARFTDGDDGFTRTGIAMGTIDFMAPEQIDDAKGADERSDIYSLGCTLYFLCAGKAVFAHRNGNVPKAVAHGREAPPKLRDSCPDAPARLEAIYQKMLRKRQEDRHQSMADVAEELRTLIAQSSAPSISVSVPSPNPAPVAPSAPSMPVWAVTMLAVLAAAVVVLGLMLAIIASRPVEESRPGPLAITPSPKPNESQKREESPAVSPPDSQPTLKGMTTDVDMTKAKRADASKIESVNPQAPRKTAEAKKVKPTPIVASFEGSEAGEERSNNGLMMKLVWCPAGTFRMGSPPSEPNRDDDEGPVTVRLTRGFWIGKYEVTQEEWRQVMGTNPSSFKFASGFKNTDRFPVDSVSWEDAMAFCRKWTEQERAAGRLPAEWEYTLPTDAQWEHACRAGTTTATAFGDRLSSTQANFNGYVPYNGAAKGPYLERTTEVGSYAGNAWGLCDMHGNVWEWCRDGYDKQLQASDDPLGPASALNRVQRGGGWYGNGNICRSSNRHGNNTPIYRSYHDGFRVSVGIKQ